MRRLAFAIAISLAAVSCATSDSAPVPVIGAAEELSPLAGEWFGSYEGAGHSGSITFHLTDDPKGAHGDVLLVPPTEIVHHGGETHHPLFAGGNVLTIEFVRIAAGEISGKIAPYTDPEHPDAMRETWFAGHVTGNTIEGTFVTMSDRGATAQRGTWRVRRKPAA